MWYRGISRQLVGLVMLGGSLIPSFAALPTTTNYSLQSFGFGAGGGSTSTSNYSLQGITGEASDGSTLTSNFTTLPGYIGTEQANVPKITLTNPSSYYDKLNFVLDNQNNPTDALFALQVQQITSSCDFASNIFYVQPDDTLSSTLVTGDYQTYSAWGSGGGQNMIGLLSNTSYCIRAKATQGQFTESAYGPSSTAATVGQQISFCLYTNANCGAGGNSESLNLLSGTVANSATNIGVDFATNGDNGGSVFIYSLGQLSSIAHPGTPITSATANLASASTGYGAQIASVSQTSGGPLSKVSPFNGSSNNVGQLSTTVQTLFNSTAPIVGGTGAVQLQAKSDVTIKSSNDYADTITVVAAAGF